MDVVEPDLIDGAEYPRCLDVEARVVQGGEEAAEDDEGQGGEGMDGEEEAGDEVNGGQVVVLARHELHGVHVHCVRITSGGGFLPMVMFVDVFVQGPMVEGAVKQGVGKVVDDEEQRKGQAGVLPCHFLHPPCDLGRTLGKPEETEEVVGKKGGSEFIEGDEA